MRNKASFKTEKVEPDLPFGKLRALSLPKRRAGFSGKCKQDYRRSVPGSANVTQPARRVLAFLFPLMLAGCMVGPDYESPEMDLPEGFRAAETETVPTDDISIGDWNYTKFVDDESLLALLDEALANNFDLQIAAARVLQAEASERIVRSQLYPSVGVGGSWTAARVSEYGPTPIPEGIDPQADYTTLALGVPAYELDFWGRIRRASEAAQARLLATEAAEQIVRQTIVTLVATRYTELLGLDLELDITERALVNRSNSLVLTEAREDGGVASLLDVRQAEVLVETARVSEVEVKRRIGQTENEISILLGRNPGPVERRQLTYEPPDKREVPTGLPSSLLQRRPDIRAAEQQLVAANADIGQARAAFYPQVSLTGSFGYQSTDLGKLFTSSAQTWQFVPSISLPIYTGGRLQANADLAEAAFDEALANYRKIVQNAFREVSDALIGYQRLRESRQRQELRTAAYSDATRLANLRYEGGVTSYFEVLFNEQEYFNSEIALAQATRNEAISLIQLYKALGGGEESTGDLAAAE